MKRLIALLLLAAIPANAQKPLRFQFQGAEIPFVISTYSKASGQKFVIDPSVRGKVTILNTKTVTLEEAFDLLSSALATQGFAISEQEDKMVVMPARSVQRSLIPVVTELPPLKPERMVTMMIPLKHVTADSIVKEMRILPSKDGEMTVHTGTNQLILSDWVSNLHRSAKVISKLDQPAQKPQ